MHVVSLFSSLDKRLRNLDDPDAWEIALDSKHIEVGVVADDFTQLLTISTFQIKQATKLEHFSLICKLTRVCRLRHLVHEIKRACALLKLASAAGDRPEEQLERVLRCSNSRRKPDF